MGLQNFLRDPLLGYLLLSLTMSLCGPSLMNEIASELLITGQEGANPIPSPNPLYGLIMEVRVNKHGLSAVRLPLLLD